MKKWLSEWKPNYIIYIRTFLKALEQGRSSDELAAIIRQMRAIEEEKRASEPSAQSPAEPVE